MGKVQGEGNPLHFRNRPLMTIKRTIECLYLDINDFVTHIDFALLYIFDPITQLYKIKLTCVEQKNLTSPQHKGVHYYVL